MRSIQLMRMAVIALLFMGTIRAQVIVANGSVRIAEINKSDLAEIFTGASTSFSDGSQAVPVTLKGGPVHEAFLKEYVGKKELLFRGNWRVLVFEGKGTMPKAFAGDEELLHYIATVPGAIGYVGTAPHGGQVKVINVK